MNLIYQKNWGSHSLEIFDRRPDFPLTKLKQVHGNVVIHQNNIKNEETEGDGIVLDRNFITPAAIITADCLPIIIMGENGFAFLHAGWRGLKNEIINASSVKSIKPIKAYIGPHIRSCCFEVQKDFKQQFPQEHFYQVRGQSLYCDLSAIAVTQLNLFHTIKDIELEKTCTCCTLQFKSFRRDGTIERNWNILKRKP